MRFFRKKKRSSSLLGIGDPGRDLDLELIGKTEEAMELRFSVARTRGIMQRFFLNLRLRERILVVEPRW